MALKFSKSINGEKTHANTDKEKRPKKKKKKKLCIKSRIKNILTRKIDKNSRRICFSLIKIKKYYELMY